MKKCKKVKEKERKSQTSCGQGQKNQFFRPIFGEKSVFGGAEKDFWVEKSSVKK